MDDEKEFREWLAEHTTCSSEALTDIVSRLKRAFRIQPWSDPDFYLFYLNKNKEFQGLSMYVRSQIRRSVRLYCEFIQLREQ